MAMRAGILLLVLLAPYFERSKLAPISVQSVYLAVMGMILVGWILASTMDGRILGRRIRLGFPMGVFFLAVALSAVAAEMNGVQFKDWLMGWYRFSALLLVFPMVEYFDTPRRVAMLAHTFLLSATLSSAYWLLATGSLPIPGMQPIAVFSRAYYATRGLALTSSDVHFWGLLLIMPVLALGRRSAPARAVLAISAVILALRWGLELSKSQLAIGLTLFVFLFASVMKRGSRMARRRVFVIVGLLALTFMLVSGAIAITAGSASTAIVDVYTNRFARLERSVAYRLSEWAAVVERVVERPLLGHGYGAVFSHVRPYGEEELFYHWVHNAPLYFCFHAGVLGLAAFLWLVARVGALIRSAMRAVAETSMGGYALGFAFMFAGMMLRALLSTSFMAISFSLSLAMIAAIAYRLGRFSAEPTSEGRSVNPPQLES